jgi:hypothetical protein
MSYTHLEKPHHAEHVGLPAPEDPEDSKGSARRGWMWIALLLAVIFWWVRGLSR